MNYWLANLHNFKHDRILTVPEKVHSKWHITYFVQEKSIYICKSVDVGVLLAEKSKKQFFSLNKTELIMLKNFKGISLPSYFSFSNLNFAKIEMKKAGGEGDWEAF